MSAISKQYHYEVNDGGRRTGRRKKAVRRLSRLKFDGAYRPLGIDRDLERLAEICADDYHSQHDGWEASWPIEMVIYEFSEAEDGPELWRGSGEREQVPEFHAAKAVQP